MIHKMPVAEFRAKLKANLERIKAGEILEVGGVPLILYKENADEELKAPENCTKEDESSANNKELERLRAKEKAFEELKQQIESKESVQEPIEGPAPNSLLGSCDSCKRLKELFVLWEDGERHVCKDCLVLRRGKDAIKMAQAVEIQEVSTEQVERTFRDPTPIVRDPIAYCVRCSFRAVYGGGNVCIKCLKKKPNG